MRATVQELEPVIRAAQQSRQVLLATVNDMGDVSFTPVHECRRVGETCISIRAWTDIPPIESRDGHNKMALLVLNTREGNAYQLTGHAVRSQTTAVLNGYAEVEEYEHFPQVQREILMEVESIEDVRFHGRESQPP